MPADSPSLGPSSSAAAEGVSTGLQRRRPSAGPTGATTTTGAVPAAGQVAAAAAGTSNGRHQQQHLQQHEQDEEDFLNRITLAAQSPGVLVPSRLAMAALLLLPLLVWLLAVLLGVLSFAGLPDSKRGVWHVMLWFDKGLFRTLAGPALPFLVLLLRLASTAGLPRPHRTKPAAPGNDDDVGRTLAPTLPGTAALAYALVTGARMLLYVSHLMAQQALLRSATAAAAAAGPGHMATLVPQQLLSDHVLLGASVMACLQVELVCGVSDAVKLAACRRTSELRLVVASAAVVLGAALMTLVSADMHFTARLFHEPAETLAALLAGLALFQVPLLLGVLRFLTLDVPPTRRETS